MQKQLKFAITIFLALNSLTSARLALAEGPIQVDDSYTVHQRYEKNRENYPEISWPNLNFEPGQTISFDLLYKQEGDRQLHLDLFSPPPELRNGKAILLVHGGAWRSGNKSHMFPLANLLAKRGYTVFTPEYRLSIEAPYPAGLIDLNDTITWIGSNADQFGIDPAAIAIGGGSSGGHMAALIGFSDHEETFNSSTDLAAIIDMDGVLDFADPLAIRYENAAKEKSGVALWVGGALETAPELWDQASPASHLSENAPPILILSSGQARFTAGHQTVEDTLTSFEIPSEFYSYENLFHTFWLFEPYVSDVANRIDQFLIENTPNTSTH